MTGNTSIKTASSPGEQVTPSAELIELEKETANHPMVSAIIGQCGEWPGYPLKRHNDAKHIIQKIGFLADIGLTRRIPAIAGIAEKLLSRQSEEGAFLTQIFIPKRFGGSDSAEWMWMLCDFPLIVHALAAFGFAGDPRVIKAMDFLASLVRDNGWPCTASIPKFKGPGKREHPCPFTNLIALKALSLADHNRFEEACRKGTQMILNHWENRKNVKYFLFGIGTDFSKLKYPYVWFDILHVVDVLSRFPWTRDDKRLKEMAAVIFDKADENQMYRAESVWMAYKGFDFAQKKEPSPTITTKIRQLIKRFSYNPISHVLRLANIGKEVQK